MNGNPFYKPWYSDELEHHGIKGMKHGVRNGPPYPLDRGKGGRITKTQKKKKASFLSRFSKKKKAKTSSKPKQTAEEKKEKSREELREELLKSTDPKFIAKHMDLLDTKEIQDRINRINTETNLKKLAEDKKSKSNVEKGLKWIDHISKVADTTSKVAKAYSDTVDAAGKKEKQQAEREKNKIETAQKQTTTKQILKLLRDYSDNRDEFQDIQIDFDSKTGKITFKSNKK